MPSPGCDGGVEPPAASLLVTTPSGTEIRMRLSPLPFRIGRLGDNNLALRDSRASRHHAQIVRDGAAYVIEDLKSRHGVFVNGVRSQRHVLRDLDGIDFGFPDSYRAVFTVDKPVAEEAGRALLEKSDSAIRGGSNLARLRAMVEVARALQTSLSTDEVLAAVVEGALAVTGCERGFLLLRAGDDLAIRIARDRNGPLPPDDLRIPTRLLHRALQQRREFLSMDFDPVAGSGSETIAALELRSVVCLPLVRVRAGAIGDTTQFSPAADTVGLLYMDSRFGAADLSVGNRELLMTLAMEASTVLENARLLEEQWEKQRLDEELRIARGIQQRLLPRKLPTDGWFRAAVSSLPSLQVGGDYLDVRQVDDGSWTSVVADVSGKGVGAALLASLLQGIFLSAPYSRIPTGESMVRINGFLYEHTSGEQYATLFYCTLDEAGSMLWVNAGHPPPLVVRATAIETLPANGLPLGMFEDAGYEVAQTRLAPGDKVIVYTDGLSEAQDGSGEFFGLKRLKAAACNNRQAGCHELHAAILSEVERFTAGAEQNDDVSLAVLEYAGGRE